MCRHNRPGPTYILMSSQLGPPSRRPSGSSAVPRKRRLTRLSTYDLPEIDPNDPVLVDDSHLVRHALVDFDELAVLPSESHQRLVADLVHAIRFARCGVKGGKRG